MENTNEHVAKEAENVIDEAMARPICPLTWLTYNGRHKHCSPDCAWYDRIAGACSVLVISQATRGLDENGHHVRVIAMERARRDGVMC